MSTSLLYRLFGIGKLPAKMRDVLESEHVELMDEGVRGSAVLRGFKAPGRYSSYRKSWFSGSLVITRLRFAAFAYSKPLVNVPLDDEHLAKLELALDGGEVLIVAFEAGDFHTDRSGWIQCSFATPMATAFHERLKGL
jgi:hypothetical protein